MVRSQTETKTETETELAEDILHYDKSASLGLPTTKALLSSNKYQYQIVGHNSKCTTVRLSVWALELSDTAESTTTTL